MWYGIRLLVCGFFLFYDNHGRKLSPSLSEWFFRLNGSFSNTLFRGIVLRLSRYSCTCFPLNKTFLCKSPSLLIRPRTLCSFNGSYSLNKLCTPLTLVIESANKTLTTYHTATSSYSSIPTSLITFGHSL